MFEIWKEATKVMLVILSCAISSLEHVSTMMVFNNEILGNFWIAFAS